MAFNYFTNRLERFQIEMTNSSAELIDFFLKKHGVEPCSLSTGGASVKADINVTPLVDVVLVLLIIFMVVTPMLQKGEAGAAAARPRTPAKKPDDRGPDPRRDQTDKK